MSLNDYIYDKDNPIGRGGNGKVYLATDPNKKEVAIKLFRQKKANSPKDKEKLDRFIIEAQEGKKLSDNGQLGILPIMHHELPCKDTGYYFYVMPVATPLEELTKKNTDLYTIIKIFKELALALKELHNHGYTHRDIKPDNILQYNGNYYFGDLGLIDYPDKENLTLDNEPLGNRQTMAPEMRTPNNITDFKPADVYSFAKTLWIVLTKEKYAFDGQFNPSENHLLQKKYDKKHFVELFKLLADSTYEDPLKRPTIHEFLERLIEWEEISRDDYRSAKSLWQYIEETVVSQTLPSTMIWRNKFEVISILQRLAISNFNHTFIPSGGGMDLIRIGVASEVNEPDMIMISFGFGMHHVLKIKRLIWELPNKDPLFSYFRLECAEVSPIYNYRNCSWNEQYIEESLNVNKVKEYEPYNPDDPEAWNITRWSKGVFLIVYKGAIYNQIIHNAYDGRHSSLNMDDFREYMELLSSVYHHPILKRYFSYIANLNPIEDTENTLEEVKELLKLSDSEILQQLESEVEDETN